jgi:hypothetical protein
VYEVSNKPSISATFEILPVISTEYSNERGGGENFWLHQAFRPLLGPLGATVFTRALHKSPVFRLELKPSCLRPYYYLLAPPMHSHRSSFYAQPELGIDRVHGRTLLPVHISCMKMPRTYSCCLNVQWPINDPVPSLYCFLCKNSKSLYTGESQ